MRATLVAIQASLREDHYASGDAFGAWVGDLARRALADVARTGGGAPPGSPVLLAYPEAIGMPLLFTLPDPAAVRGSTGLAQAALRSLRGRWGEVLTAAVRHRAFGLEAVYLARALPAYRAYDAAFRAVARETGATVVAGSAFLPEVEREAARGVHVRGRRVFNVSYVYGPGGTPLGRRRKAYLTPGAESRAGLSRGRVEEQRAFVTPLGRLGVAICLDGWFDGVLAALDGDGASVVVQPSANDAPWERPWPSDPSLREGEAWLGRGLRDGLQGRLHLRYGVNPMAVGEVFGFRPRGRSSIVANAALVPGPWVEGRTGVLALAPDAEAEGWVHASVALEPPVGDPARGGRMRS